MVKETKSERKIDQTEIEKTLTGDNIYTVLKHIPVGIVFIECPNGKIIYANDRAIELYGVNPLGLEIKDQTTKPASLLLLNGELYPTEMSPLNRALEGVIVTDEELVVERHRDGSRIIVSANAVPVKNDKGVIAGAVGVFADITERRKLEEELRLYKDSLEELVAKQAKQIAESERLAAIGQTARMVAHDIRNPLQSIINEVYLAKMELDEVPEGRGKTMMLKSMKNVEAEVAYISKIVLDLQDFSKPPTPSIKEFNLETLIADVLSIIDTPETIKVSYSLEEKGLRLKSDPALLRRILVNLATNAVQAMPKGGSLTTNVNRNNGKVFISIEDTREGLPDEVKDRPFTPFVTTKAKGQGLGLAVVKRLTNSLNGEISFVSQKGKGTKFTLELPDFA
jgi:PAS domain S-box-containing protein